MDSKLSYLAINCACIKKFVVLANDTYFISVCLRYKLEAGLQMLHFFLHEQSIHLHTLAGRKFPMYAVKKIY